METEIKKILSDKEITTKSSKMLKTESSKDKSKQVLSLVQQCINSQYTFGKTEEQLSDLKRVMIMGLVEYRVEDINEAFLEWMRENEKHPTLNGILKILNKILGKRFRENHGVTKKLSDFHGNFVAYKNYLIELKEGAK